MTGPLLVKYIHPLFFALLSLLGIGAADVTGNRIVFDWIFKLGHVWVFMSLGLCFFALQMRLRAGLVWILSMLLMIAIASEGRSFMFQIALPVLLTFCLFVCLFDCIGIVLAWAAVMLFRAIRNLRQ